MFKFIRKPRLFFDIMANRA